MGSRFHGSRMGVVGADGAVSNLVCCAWVTAGEVVPEDGPVGRVVLRRPVWVLTGCAA